MFLMKLPAFSLIFAFFLTLMHDKIPLSATHQKILFLHRDGIAGHGHQGNEVDQYPLFIINNF